MIITLDINSNFLKTHDINTITLKDCILDYKLIQEAELILVLNRRDQILNILKSREYYPTHFFLGENIMSMDKLLYLLNKSA